MALRIRIVAPVERASSRWPWLLGPRSRPVRWIIGLAACLGGCSAAAPDPDVFDGRERLCDETTDVRLAGVVAGGGPAFYGQQMMGENGFQYLIVQGTCDAWVLADIAQPLRHVVLTAADEGNLTRELRLAQWREISAPAAGCPDAPGMSLRAGPQKLSGVPCGAEPQSAFAAVAQAFTQSISELSVRGAAVDGDMRYWIVAGNAEAAEDAIYRNAAPWPLSTDIADEALTRESAWSYVPGHSHRAVGADAARLRSLRESARDSGVSAAFVPVLGPGGQRYELYTRDACPLEEDDGRLVDVF